DGQFYEKVSYIYRKQLKEADLIVINKCNLHDAEQRDRLQSVLQEEFPTTRQLEISARNGLGLAPWFQRLMTEHQSARPAVAVDYEIYAEGESLLGWLNATLQLSANTPFDGNALLERLARELQTRLAAQGAEIAHLKMTLDPAGGLGELAVMNLVRNDYRPELSQPLEEPLQAGQVILNLRAEVSPECLRRTLEEALAMCSAP